MTHAELMEVIGPIAHFYGFTGDVATPTVGTGFLQRQTMTLGLAQLDYHNVNSSVGLFGTESGTRVGICHIHNASFPHLRLSPDSWLEKIRQIFSPHGDLCRLDLSLRGVQIHSRMPTEATSRAQAVSRIWRDLNDPRAVLEMEGNHVVISTPDMGSDLMDRLEAAATRLMAIFSL